MGFFSDILSDARLPLGRVESSQRPLPDVREVERITTPSPVYADSSPSAMAPVVAPNSDDSLQVRRQVVPSQSVAVGTDAAALPISDTGIQSTPPPIAMIGPSADMNAESLAGRNPATGDRLLLAATPDASSFPPLQEAVSQAEFSSAPQTQRPVEADVDVKGHLQRALSNAKAMHVMTQTPGADDVSPPALGLEDSWRIVDPAGRTLQVRSRTLTTPVSVATQQGSRSARPAVSTQDTSFHERVPVPPVARPGSQSAPPARQTPAHQTPAPAPRATTSPDVRIGRIDVIIAPPTAPEPTATTPPSAKSEHGFASRHYLRGR